MQEKQITIPGDTPGLAWTINTFSFPGNVNGAPSIYLQGGLHADELPGPATLHFLCQMLHQADVKDQIAGNITIIPQANPVGTAQNLFSQNQGRFDLASRTNFNRDFPLVDLSENPRLTENLKSRASVDQLKAVLLHTAIEHDIVIDLHCDDESLLYAYIGEQFWPAGKDFAAALDLKSVFLSDGYSSAFEEAVAYAWKNQTNLSSRFVTTLELRGQSDVYEQTARDDAARLYEFLKMRGIIKGKTNANTTWSGVASPLDNIEIVRAPQSGVVLFHKDCGNKVKAGELIATILTTPGRPDGALELTSPQDGTIITRISARFAARNQKLFKIACAAPSATRRPPGALES